MSEHFLQLEPSGAYDGIVRGWGTSILCI